MSRQFVRDAFIAELNALPTVYVESINRRDPITVPVWCTAEFFPDFVRPICYSWAKQEETGSVDIDVFCRAGLGSAPALTAAEAILDHFAQWSTPGIEVESVMSAQEISDGEAEGLFYGVTISIGYIYRY